MITSNVTTLTLNGDETAVEFEKGYPYYFIRNDGDAPIYVSLSPGITPGAEGVYAIPAGAVERIGSGYSLPKFYILGTGEAYIRGEQIAAQPSFKRGGKGGDKNVISGYVFNGLVYQVQQSVGDYKSTYSFDNSINLDKPATIEFCGVYTYIPQNSNKGRWLDIVYGDDDDVFVMSQYDDILEIYYGDWFIDGATNIQIASNEYVTISAICNDTSFSIYINGVFVSTFDITNTQDIKFNRIAFMQSAYRYDRKLDGKLNSFRIYNRALTENEILHNANVDKFMYF